jgi:hypothetical protein
VGVHWRPVTSCRKRNKYWNVITQTAVSADVTSLAEFKYLGCMISTDDTKMDLEGDIEEENKLNGTYNRAYIMTKRNRIK